MELPQLPARPKCDRCNLSQRHPEHPYNEPGLTKEDRRHIHTNCSIGTPFEWDKDSLPPGPDVDAVVFVGGSPSFLEDKYGTPWVKTAPGGMYLRDVYVTAARLLDKTSVYYGNIIRCRTGFKDPPPTKKQMKACRPWLDEDLDAIARVHCNADRYLVMLGAKACEAILGTASVRKASRMNGQIVVLTPEIDRG